MVDVCEVEAHKGPFITGAQTVFEWIREHTCSKGETIAVLVVEARSQSDLLIDDLLEFHIGTELFGESITQSCPHQWWNSIQFFYVDTEVEGIAEQCSQAQVFANPNVQADAHTGDDGTSVSLSDSEMTDAELHAQTEVVFQSHAQAGQEQILPKCGISEGTHSHSKRQVFSDEGGGEGRGSQFPEQEVVVVRCRYLESAVGQTRGRVVQTCPCVAFGERASRHAIGFGPEYIFVLGQSSGRYQTEY
jgi:hypothetical protein